MLLNTRIDGLSRGKHVPHTLPNAYHSSWLDLEPPESSKGYKLNRHNSKPVLILGKRWENGADFAKAANVPYQSVVRWLKDKRKPDFTYL